MFLRQKLHSPLLDILLSDLRWRAVVGIDTPTEKWQKIIGVNVMSEIFAAQYAIPHMLEQGSGYLLNVASAAGLLVIFDTASYTVAKHDAVSFTEWLAATYDDQGVGVSLLIPAAVKTPILPGKDDTPQGHDAITTDELADIVIKRLAEERFLINTYPRVLEKFAVQARDYDEYTAMLRRPCSGSGQPDRGVNHARLVIVATGPRAVSRAPLNAFRCSPANSSASSRTTVKPR
jgi:NAD(P)-dependent dehydrogenase (short-subunit alcohol dehydrogenase family)